MDLKNFLNLLLQKFVLIVFIVMFFMIGSALVSALFIAPQYTTSATLIINKAGSAETSNMASDYTYNDLLFTQKLVNTYSVVISSDAVLDKVIENLRLPMSTEVLRSKLTVTGINNTEIIRITITDEIPLRAMDIANEITRVCPDEIIRTVKAGSVELIDSATLPETASSPNITKNTLLGGLVGLALIIGIIYLAEFLNQSIKSSDDVENLLGLPVLGQLPEYKK